MILQSSRVSRVGGLAREEKACLSGRDFLLHCLVGGRTSSSLSWITAVYNMVEADAS